MPMGKDKGKSQGPGRVRMDRLLLIGVLEQPRR